MSSQRLNTIIAPLFSGLSALYTMLRNYFLTGVIILVPTAVTLYITMLLFVFADGFLGDGLNKALGVKIPGIGLFATLMVFIFTGIIAQNVIGKRFLRWMDISLQSLPGVRSLYLGVKQVSDVLFQKEQHEFQRVVLVEYPKSESWVLGFVTNDFPLSFVSAGLPGDMICVFVPTTPNPTSGFLLILSKSKIVDTNFGIEEAMKMIISGGLVNPTAYVPARAPTIFEDFTIPR